MTRSFVLSYSVGWSIASATFSARSNATRSVHESKFGKSRGIAVTSAAFTSVLFTQSLHY
jgi:hypothetical protein